MTKTTEEIQQWWKNILQPHLQVRNSLQLPLPQMQPLFQAHLPSHDPKPHQVETCILSEAAGGECYTSPQEIIPFPKAEARKTTPNCRRRRYSRKAPKLQTQKNKVRRSIFEPTQEFSDSEDLDVNERCNLPSDNTKYLQMKMTLPFSLLRSQTSVLMPTCIYFAVLQQQQKL